MKHTYIISDLSPHLFWDVDSSLLDFEKSKDLIIQKVLEYGVMKDWQIINNVYGKGIIKDTALHLRNLDEVTLSFLSNIYQINKQDFKCFSHKTLI
jgi:hypothetical protein